MMWLSKVCATSDVTSSTTYSVPVYRRVGQLDEGSWPECALGTLVWTKCNTTKRYTCLSFVVVVDVVVIFRLIRIQCLVYPLTLSFIPTLILLKRFPHTYVILNNSFSNIIIPSQRLVTMSASLRTQTVLRCLIIQVLNIKSLLPKCLIQSLSLLYTVIYSMGWQY